MDIRNKLQKEVDLYKDLEKNKLKKIIRQYKIMSFLNSDLFYFIFTMIIFGGVFLLIVKISFVNIFLIFLFHYIFFWEILYKLTKFRSEDIKEKKEVDQIIKILEERLKNKNPPV